MTLVSIWVFFHEHSRITGLQGTGEGISLSPHYHFHPLRRHLDISRASTAESSPLHIASSRTRTGNLWFPSTIRWPLHTSCKTSKTEITTTTNGIEGKKCAPTILKNARTTMKWKINKILHLIRFSRMFLFNVLYSFLTTCDK